MWQKWQVLSYYWASNINKGDLTGIVLLDLCKAFDLVDHNLLLHKLSMYRISDRSLKWFKSYLTDRQQVVKFKQSVSDPLQVVSGVPHRSILEPLLFIIFMNDITLETEDTELDMYADDLTLDCYWKIYRNPRWQAKFRYGKHCGLVWW